MPRGPVDQEMAMRLRRARELAGYKSAADAANRMRVKYPTYSAHENGTTGFVRQATKYATFFKVDYKWLVLGVGSPRGRTFELEMLDLTPDEQKELLRYKEFLKSRRSA